MLMALLVLLLVPVALAVPAVAAFWRFRTRVACIFRDAVLCVRCCGLRSQSTRSWAHDKHKSRVANKARPADKAQRKGKALIQIIRSIYDY